MLGETANLKLPNAAQSGFLPLRAQEDSIPISLGILSLAIIDYPSPTTVERQLLWALYGQFTLS